MIKHWIFITAFACLSLAEFSFAKGFMGKRNMVDYDVLGGPLSGSRSFAYTRVKNNHLAYRLGFSHTSFALSNLKNNIVFQGDIQNYFNSNVYPTVYDLSAVQNPVFTANTYSLAFVFSSSYANLDLPVGYFAAYTLYYTKGASSVNLTVPAEYYSFILPGHERTIIGQYSFKQIGSTFDIGKTYYLHPGFVFSVGAQMGAYLRFSTESFSEDVSIYNASSAPLAGLYSAYPYTLPKQIPFSLNLLDESPGLGFNFMPFLRFGYLF